MPRANIYIRKENAAAWEASSKSDWINDHLQKTTARPSYVIGMAPEDGIIPMTASNDVIPMTASDVISLEQARKLRSVQESKGVEFCKHNQVKGFCKKGCK